MNEKKRCARRDRTGRTCHPLERVEVYLRGPCRQCEMRRMNDNFYDEGYVDF
jgi:hypothetical protein